MPFSSYNVTEIGEDHHFSRSSLVNKLVGKGRTLSFREVSELDQYYSALLVIILMVMVRMTLIYCYYGRYMDYWPVLLSLLDLQTFKCLLCF